MKSWLRRLVDLDIALTGEIDTSTLLITSRDNKRKKKYDGNGFSVVHFQKGCLIHLVEWIYGSVDGGTTSPD